MYIIVLSTRNAVISGGLLIQEQHMCYNWRKNSNTKTHTHTFNVENISSKYHEFSLSNYLMFFG